MIRNTPVPPVQKLRSRSTLRVSLDLFIDITVHRGIKCATARRNSELRSNERHISCAYLSNSVHICCAMLTLRHKRLLSLLQNVTISMDCLPYAYRPAILSMSVGDVTLLQLAHHFFTLWRYNL